MRRGRVPVVVAVIAALAAPASAQMMVSTIHMPCEGNLPANGFRTENVSAVCGIAPPHPSAQIVTTDAVPEGFLHMSHYYHASMIGRQTLHRRAERRSGPCYAANVTTTDAWHRLSVDRSNGALCAYGGGHTAAYLLRNPLGYLSLVLSPTRTAHLH